MLLTDPAVNSIAVLSNQDVVATGGNKKLLLLAKGSQESKVFYEKPASGECRHLVSTDKDLVVSAWEDGAVIVHQPSTDVGGQLKSTPLSRKCTILPNSKTLHLSHDKSTIYYLSEGSLVQVQLETLSEVTVIPLGAGIDPAQLASNQQGIVFVLDKKGTVVKVDTNTKTTTKHVLADSRSCTHPQNSSTPASPHLTTSWSSPAPSRSSTPLKIPSLCWILNS